MANMKKKKNETVDRIWNIKQNEFKINKREKSCMKRFPTLTEYY